MSPAPMCGQMGLLHCKPDPLTHLTVPHRLGEGSDLPEAAHTWCQPTSSPLPPLQLPITDLLSVKERVLWVHNALVCACKDLFLCLHP